MISVQNLSTKYSSHAPEVLKGVSLQLASGEVGVLLGPNGSGKSTLLKCVLGLLKYQGSVLLDGRDAKAISPREKAKLIAYVPQNFTFAPSTVFDAVMLGRIPYFGLGPTEEDRQCVLNALAEVGLADFLSRNVEELSGGERQKVAIGRALAQQAKIMVFDEPTSNLDVAAELDVAALIKRLAKEQKLTALVCVHDVNLGLDIGTRFFWLKEGRLIGDVEKKDVDETLVGSVFGVACSRVAADGRDIFIFKGEKQ